MSRTFAMCRLFLFLDAQTVSSSAWKTVRHDRRLHLTKSFKCGVDKKCPLIMKNTCPNRLTKSLKSPVLHNFNLILQKQRNMLILKQKFAIFNWTLFVLFISLFIRYHNTREVATHKIRNTVTHDGDCGWQGSRDIAQEKGPFPPPHATGLPVSGPIGLHSSLPFQD